MAKSQQSYNKKEREKNRLKKQKDKVQKREERKANSQGGGLENMLAYVDENGNITNTPPDPNKKTEIDLESIEIGVPKKEEEEYNPIRRGRVDFFNTSKGFGFIKDFENQESYFVHINNMEGDIREGDTVIFEIERGVKGMNAVRVKKEKAAQ